MLLDALRVLPDTGFVRLPTVLAVIPISKSSWWSGVKSGKYPAGYKLGRCTLWRAEDIHELIAAISHAPPRSTSKSEKASKAPQQRYRATPHERHG